MSEFLDQLEDEARHKKRGSSSLFLDQLDEEPTQKEIEKPSKPTALQQIKDLEAEAAAKGVSVIPPDVLSGAFHKLLDLISRPGYAVSGAVEETLKPTGEGAIGRASRELVGEGEKRGFGEVFERAGVPRGPHLSQVLPINEGSTFDISTRGTAGLAADIFLDPASYVGIGPSEKTAKLGEKFLSRAGTKALRMEVSGALRDAAAIGLEESPGLRQLAVSSAKNRVQELVDAGRTDLIDRGGIKWAGWTIPGTPEIAAASRGVSDRMLKRLAESGAGAPVVDFGAKLKTKYLDPVGRAFVKGYRIRNIPEAAKEITDWTNIGTYQSHLFHEEFKASPLGAVKGSAKAGTERYRDAVDAYEGTVGRNGIESVDPSLQPEFGYLREKMSQAEDLDRASGHAVGPGLENYIPTYYENDPEDVARVYSAWKGYVPTGELVKGNWMERAFRTKKQAIEVSAWAHAKDPSMPILKPIYDIREIVRRRMEASIAGATRHDMLRALEAKYGKMPEMGEVFDLTPPAVSATGKLAEEMPHISENIVKGETDLKFVRSLSDEGKREFFRQRFSNIESTIERIRTENKYDEFADYFPRELDRVPDPGFAGVKSGNRIFNIPRDMAAEINAMEEPVFHSRMFRDFVRGMDRLANGWKGSVTWLFPNFHVRNYYNNGMQMVGDIGLEALNPRRVKQAFDVLRGADGSFATKLGTRYSYDELRDALSRYGVKTRAEALAELTGHTKTKLPFRKIGTRIENESRAQLFLSYVRRGMDLDEAGRRVNKVLFDYDHGLTQFEQHFMRRLVPFYSWQRQNFSLMLDNLRKRPGLVSAQLKPFLGRRSEDEQMTTFDAGDVKLRLNRDGKTVRMLTGIDIPIRNLDNIWRGTPGRTLQGLLGQVTPLLRLPFEAGLGVSAFTGKPLGRKESASVGRLIEHFPKPIQDFMMYHKDTDMAGRPRYTFDGARFYVVTNALMASRVVSTGDRVFRASLDTQDTGWLNGLLHFATGLSVKDVNLDESEKRRNQERIKLIEEALYNRGERRQFQRYYTPKH